ncbi:MAG: amino acid ABC transporter permease [Lachnospiraceae bacterium]|nr:amino acid ABC transporter permease [Lachnospiraceae bacterium]
MSLDISFIKETFPEVLKAVPVTLLVTALPVILGAIFGFFVALLHIRKIPVINQILELLISFFRSVPLIILLFCSYYGVPKLINFMFYKGERVVGTTQISGMTVALIVYTVYSTAYISELIRGALASVDLKQMEAAHSIGMTKFSAYTRIVIPQAIMVAMPNYFNFVLATLKNTSLVFAISVMDIMATAKVAAEKGYRFIEAYVMVGIIYIVLGVTLSAIFKKVEKNSKMHMGIVTE